MTPIQVLDKQLVELKKDQSKLKTEYEDLRTKLDENIIHQDNAAIDIRNIVGAIEILKNTVVEINK